MKTIYGKDRPKIPYIDFIQQKLGGEKVSDIELRIDNELSTAKFIVVETDQYRITGFEYTAKEDTQFQIVHDPKYDYTLSIFARDVIYYKEEEEREISVPNGFIFAKGTQKMAINFKKGVTKTQMVYAFNKGNISEYLLQVIDTLDHFFYHSGNENITAWKSSFTQELRNNIHEQFRKEFVTHKLMELKVILHNTLYQFNEKSDDVLFTDFEINAAFSIRNDINKDFTQRPNIKKLALTYGINHTKLGKIFKELFGKTIYKYFKDERLFKVKELITNTNKTFTEIAYEYAFTDVNHFSKSIVDEFGMTPSAMRKEGK
ncbi:helix-turn-helix domain-containing protein [Flammeovirga agarivorans]|uniref:Helix-turn-helix transcriptional regulator n=1 Tax=Flammeovirga agarivorans TaxID=2726742 RepID=A0A7X8SQD7_9BACT|nr:AraC family transcriptional regulator [Flammeovirga agarivorans]NLR94420.1 helix-turn-helix transcriptional regulator [Flammeovirga agarivorans]